MPGHKLEVSCTKHTMFCARVFKKDACTETQSMLQEIGKCSIRKCSIRSSINKHMEN